MKPSNENIITFFQHKHNKSLKTGIIYEFKITHSAFVEAKAEIQLVFELKTTGSTAKHSLLQNFSLGTERCSELFKNFFPLDASCNFVTAIQADLFVGCSGICSLAYEKETLLVDIKNIEVEFYSRSSLHEGLLKAELGEDEDELRKTVTFNDNRFCQPIQPKELKTRTLYYFATKKAHCTIEGIVQVVYELLDLKTEKKFYLLEEYLPGSPRFEQFISEAYSVPASEGCVIEVSPRDLCNCFSGTCVLQEVDNRLRIDFDFVALEETLLSSIYDEQVEKRMSGGEK